MTALRPILLLLLCVLSLSSCATITRGSTDEVIVRTWPEGASVYLSNGMTGISPVTFELPRNESVVVDIELDGYEPVEVTLNPKISSEGGAGMAGNIFLGGVIGAAVDAGSGAMYDLTPNPLEITLIPLDGPRSYDGPGPGEESMEEPGPDGWDESFEEELAEQDPALPMETEPVFDLPQDPQEVPVPQTQEVPEPVGTELPGQAGQVASPWQTIAGKPRKDRN
ncbi:MAG: PEGA domain-containing protein [Planctomycetota bacterium]